VLLRAFPFAGTFIDWKKTRNHACRQGLTAQEATDLFPLFFREHVGSRASEPAYYANDGVAIKLRASVATFEANLSEFIDLPHTNYFMAVDGSWCLTLRMNGDMDYGEAPER